MVRGIHYFSAEVKPKLMSSQGAALNVLPHISCLDLIFVYLFRLVVQTGIRPNKLYELFHLQWC